MYITQMPQDSRISGLFFHYLPQHIKRVKAALPEYGNVGILGITDKQFGDIQLFYGKKEKTPNAPDQQNQDIETRKCPTCEGAGHFVLSSTSPPPFCHLKC